MYGFSHRYVRTSCLDEFFDFVDRKSFMASVLEKELRMEEEGLTSKFCCDIAAVR